MAEEQLTVRAAARRRKPLDGADVQALEGALQQAERELAVAVRYAAEARELLQKALLGSAAHGTREWVDRFNESTTSYPEQQVRKAVLELAAKPPQKLKMMDTFGKPKCKDCRKGNVDDVGVCWFIEKTRAKAAGVWCNRWPDLDKE